MPTSGNLNVGNKSVVFTAVSIGSTPGPQILTHNLGKTDVQVEVYLSGTQQKVGVGVERTNVNQVTINAFGSTKTVDVIIQG